jgi:hypothetical protein
MKASAGLLSIKRPIEKRYNFGVYFLLKGDEVVYVGKSVNSEKRVFDHVGSEKDFDSYCFIPCESEYHDDLLDMEAQYILKYLPKYNYMFGAGNAGGYISLSAFSLKHEYKYVSIKNIVIKEKIPFISLNGNKRYKESDLLVYADKFISIQIIK